MKLRGLLILLGGLYSSMVMGVPHAYAQLNDPTNVHITCIPTSSCFGSTVGQVTNQGNTNPSFFLNMQPQGQEGTGITTPSHIGDLVLKLLVPSTSSLGNNITVCLSSSCSSSNRAALYLQKGTNGTGLYNSGGLDTFLGITCQSTACPNFNAYASASNQSGAGTPTGFHVYLANLGAFSLGQSITVYGFNGNLPIGTVILSNVINCDPTAPGSTCFTAGNVALSGQTSVNGTPLSETLTINGPGGAVPEPASLALFGSGICVLGGYLRRRISK